MRELTQRRIASALALAPEWTQRCFCKGRSYAQLTFIMSKRTSRAFAATTLAMKRADFRFEKLLPHNYGSARHFLEFDDAMEIKV
jgi:hypothetical protein